MDNLYEYSEEEGKYEYGEEEEKFIELIRPRILYLREHKPNSPEIERLMKIVERFVCLDFPDTLE